MSAGRKNNYRKLGIFAVAIIAINVVQSIWVWNCCVDPGYRVYAAINIGVVGAGFSVMYGFLAKHAFAQSAKAAKLNARLLFVWAAMSVFMLIYTFTPNEFKDDHAMVRGLSMFAGFSVIALVHVFFGKRIKTLG